MRTTETSGSRFRSLFGNRGATAEPEAGQERELWASEAWAEGAERPADPLADAAPTTTVEAVAAPAAPEQDHEPEDTVHDPIGSTERRDPRPAADASARAAWDAVVDLFEKAMTDPNIAERVGRAGLRVRLRALDLDGEAVVLDMRGGLEVLDDAPGAETELGLGTADLERLAEGRLRMAMAIAAGRAPYTGTIRPFLWVLPVVQAIARPPAAVGTAHDVTNEDLA